MLLHNPPRRQVPLRSYARTSGYQIQTSLGYSKNQGAPVRLLSSSPTLRRSFLCKTRPPQLPSRVRAFDLSPHRPPRSRRSICRPLSSASNVFSRKQPLTLFPMYCPVKRGKTGTSPPVQPVLGMEILLYSGSGRNRCQKLWGTNFFFSPVNDDPWILAPSPWVGL